MEKKELINELQRVFNNKTNINKDNQVCRYTLETINVNNHKVSRILLKDTPNTINTYSQYENLINLLYNSKIPECVENSKMLIIYRNNISLLYKGEDLTNLLKKCTEIQLKMCTSENRILFLNLMVNDIIDDIKERIEAKLCESNN